MGRPISKMEGMRYGRLVVVERAFPEGMTSRKNSYWKVRCDCGNETVVTRTNLKHGTRSCGCYAREVAGDHARTHGMSGTRLHGIWNSMKSRCYIPTAGNAKYYHDRGIRMCESWRINFTAFKDWMLAQGWDGEASYKEMLTVDRIDNDGDYSPDNCRLVSWHEQHQNKRQRGTA